MERSAEPVPFASATGRFVFLLNLPPSALVLVAARRHVPESLDPSPRRLDLAGSLLLVLALGGLAWGLIEAGGRTGVSPAVVAALLGGVALLGAFAVVERRRDNRMVPVEVFAEPQFRAVNAVTVLVYGALGSVFFLLALHLQGVLGYSALEAGAASLPITVLLLVLSPPAGALAQAIGPRLQLTAGPCVMAAAALLIGRIDAGDSYLSAVLPAVTLFGLGLSATVAPLTATALGALEDRHAGLASGVNTAVARAAQLAAVAAVPVLAGMSGAGLGAPRQFEAGFGTAMHLTAVIAAAGGFVGFLTVRNPLAEG